MQYRKDQVSSFIKFGFVVGTVVKLPLLFGTFMIAYRTLLETVLLVNGTKIIIEKGTNEKYCSISMKKNGQRMAIQLKDSEIDEFIDILRESKHEK